jgi:SAM-dependent methyltransferase
VATLARSSQDLLGIAPRRQMTGGRAAEAATMARIDRTLAAMRGAGRRAIMILDNKCGDGRLLIHAARRASALGFVVIDAGGFDRSLKRIAAARAAAAQCREPDIRFTFAPRFGGVALDLDDDADLMIADPDEDPPGELDRLTHPTGTIIEHRFAPPA